MVDTEVWVIFDAEQSPYKWGLFENIIIIIIFLPR